MDGTLFWCCWHNPLGCQLAHACGVFARQKNMIWGAAMLIVCAALLFGIGDNDRDIDDDRKSESTENISKDLHDE
jgi:hypothetical protein